MIEDIKSILIDEKSINEKCDELGKLISDDYRGKDLRLVCVLKGAVVFMSELFKRISIPAEIDFMAVSSYGNSTSSTGEAKVLKDLDNSVEGKNILIVEDIIDTGITLSYLKKTLENRGAESVRIVALLDKPARRKVDIKVDYTGFTIPDEFIVGFGLDYAEKYRNLPFIGTLKEDVYKNE